MFVAHNTPPPAVVEDAESGLFADGSDDAVGSGEDVDASWTGGPAALSTGDLRVLEEEAARKGFGKLYAIFNGGVEGLRACAAGEGDVVCAAVCVVLCALKQIVAALRRATRGLHSASTYMTQTFLYL